ncbi:hypothetical protein BBP40_011117 [Aspergillus hancockii]|nr:hypothetical protein BBP40_011117 [Aspergillus hancockii]
MSKIAPQPSSPAEWQKYANSDTIATIPLTQDEKKEGPHTMIRRAVYLDESAVVTPPSQLFYVYSDVFAFTRSDITINLEDFGLVQVVARVLTAATPTHLRVASPPNGCQVYIYGSILDQPVTVSSGDSDPVSLELGPGTGNVGVLLRIEPNQTPNIEYQQIYLNVVDVDFQANLETQMRIALALFWENISIAISLCAYVATMSANPPLYTGLNTQAVALGQQLAAHAMTGPDMSYAPVLKIDQYRPALEDTLGAVYAFKEQYDRFQDKEESLENQKKAWKVMLSQAQSQKGNYNAMSDLAIAKYHDATVVVASCQEQMQADNKELLDAENMFEDGLLAWEERQKFLAALGIFGAIIMSIGKICLGDPSSIGPAVAGIEEAAKMAEEAEKIPDQTGVVVSSKTLKTLGDSMRALEKLYPAVDGLVQAIQTLATDPDTEIPSIADISGSSQGDADANAIVALGGWETWKLECDNQLQFAVDYKVPGASEYRLALQKHSINGKALAQAEAEAIKAGNEYIQAEMEVIACDKDIANLIELLDQYQGQLEIYSRAEAKFFDRYWAVRTSLVIEMRKIIWAYKYWALQDSTVVLDSQKPIEEFVMDISTLDHEIETAAERYATDFQPFNWTVRSHDLPSNYGPLMIEGLQSESHSASFTLAPSTNPNNEPSFASVFTDGAHFRLDGLETFLRGVVPQPDAIVDGVVQVDIQISTSGVYADIQDGKVFNFTSITRSVRLSYDLTASGERGETHVHATFPTEEHSEPTPFTQWTIKLLHPEKLDLSGLTGVDLDWTGHARFDASRKNIMM